MAEEVFFVGGGDVAGGTARQVGGIGWVREGRVGRSIVGRTGGGGREGGFTEEFDP